MHFSIQIWKPKYLRLKNHLRHRQDSMANDVFIIFTKPGELSLVQKEDSKSNLIEKCKMVNRKDVLERIDISDERNLPIHLHNSSRVAIYNKARGILSRNEENEIPSKQRRQAENRKRAIISMED